MRNSKLYDVLSLFTKVEQNRLRRYIQSPYFNVNDVLEQYFEVLITDINDKEATGMLSKEKIWQKVYGKVTYNDDRFRKLNSELYKLVEGFLAQQNFEENPLHQSRALLEQVLHKKNERLYKSARQTAENSIAKAQKQTADYFLQTYLIDNINFEFWKGAFDRSDTKNIDRDFEPMLQKLDHYYIMEKLRWYSFMLSNNSLNIKKFNILFIDEIMKISEQMPEIGNSPILKTHLVRLKLQLNPDDETFFDLLITLLNDNEKHFSENELYDFYSSGLNYCIQRLNRGHAHFLRRFFDLYNIMLEKRILFMGSKTREISPWHFKNIILTASHLKEFDWAEDFIKNNIEHLPKEKQKNAQNFNLGLIYFHQKKYDKVIEQLHNVDYEDIAYNLDSKAMLIAVYYEKKDFEAMLGLAETFKTYLHRKKDDKNAEMRNSYLNYVHYAKKLPKLQYAYKEEIEKTRDEIRAKGGIVSRKWLLEKLDALL